MKKSKSILLFFILIQFIFAGCSSLPSESDARKYLEAKISEESKGNIELVIFQKSNGIEQDVFGQKLYDMEFFATVEILKDGHTNDYKGKFSFKFYDQPDARPSFQQILMPRSEAKKGQRFELKGTLRYEKTEKGWRIAKQFGKDAIDIERQ